ncbi:hypothetical protein B0181_11805, partial [Moraxella caviae]
MHILILLLFILITFLGALVVFLFFKGKSSQYFLFSMAASCFIVVVVSCIHKQHQIQQIIHPAV